MPAVIPLHVAIRTRLRESVSHALSLNERLESVIAVKSRVNSGAFHGKVDHSQPPWSAAVANAVLDLHAMSREAEGRLRASLSLPYRPRGGSSDNTGKAMESLLRLSEGADDAYVRENIRWLDGWCRKASIALNEAEVPRRLPRMEGQGEPSCPCCECRTLRMLPLHGLIRCVNPECRDDKDRKPSARLEYSDHAGEMVLRWQDDIIGLPVAA
jgi:hypothetical protein